MEGRSTIPLFWVDIAFTSIGIVVSAALMLIVLASGLGEPLNRGFALLTFLQAVWAGAALVMRFALYFGFGNSLLFGEITALLLFLMSIAMLIFSAIYVGRSSRWLIWIAMLGFILMAALLEPLFTHKLISNPRLDPNGTTLADVSPLGVAVSTIPSLFLLWAFYHFWRERRRMGGISMAFSVLIILSGFLLGAVLEIHVPIQSLAHTLSICILGAGVLSRQLFNPLRQTTESLRREIKERGRVEKSLTLSLHEKDVLLKEIHHRVKNNLQVMVSLLNLQAQKIRDKRLLGLFTESRNRIHSMALIHEQLYQSASFSDLDFETYINALVRNLCRSYVSASCPVEIEVHAKAVHLNIQKAVPCGLVLNEIVSNALKYAFPAGFRRRSRITVSMHESVDGWIHIAVKDNGAGLPKGFIPATSKSLGMELIHMITQDQLQGRVRVASRPGSGTEVRFEFPVHEKK